MSHTNTPSLEPKLTGAPPALGQHTFAVSIDRVWREVTITAPKIKSDEICGYVRYSLQHEHGVSAHQYFPVPTVISAQSHLYRLFVNFAGRRYPAQVVEFPDDRLGLCLDDPEFDFAGKFRETAECALQLIHEDGHEGRVLYIPPFFNETSTVSVLIFMRSRGRKHREEIEVLRSRVRGAAKLKVNVIYSIEYNRQVLADRLNDPHLAWDAQAKRCIPCIGLHNPTSDVN